MSSSEDRDIEPFDWFNRFFGSFKNIETKAPKDLVREYQTPGGGKVREYGPFVYGYSMTIGSDGKPKVREFGNVNHHLVAQEAFPLGHLSHLKENHWQM